jgi:hypothetical protein
MTGPAVLTPTNKSVPSMTIRMIAMNRPLDCRISRKPALRYVLVFIKSPYHTISSMDEG